jgi:putative N6-adenine-specific DNA methylase
MTTITLIATTQFGLETLVKRELTALGFKNLKVSNGKVEFEATTGDIPKVNMWLRCAGRVLLKMGEFRTDTFDALFEGTKALPWEAWITKDGKFTVSGKSVKSSLGSIRACQSIAKKAVVERLKAKYHTEWFEESGPEFGVLVSLRNNVATLSIDTSGTGLNKRGYRGQVGQAALRETHAAALVMLSFWDEDRRLIDPMCGSGTILIEAAMIARNIAPGLRRGFAAETWPAIERSAWNRVRKAAQKEVRSDLDLQIFGYDIDQTSILASKQNAKRAGVRGDIHFEQKDVKDLWIDTQYGILISNPPYGLKSGEHQKLNKIYISLNKTFRKKKGWSVYILTADKKFPDYFKRSPPDKVRKLYNGNIEVNYFQYFGERPRGSYDK